VKYDRDSDPGSSIPNEASDIVDLGSAQVSIVARAGFSFENLTSVNGIWSQNSRVNQPPENPQFDYIDVGYLSSFPNNGLSAQSEILLFTFNTSGPCPESMYLMDHGDPFYAPNSAGKNPGNNFDVIDKGFLPNLFLYSWSGNYQDSIDICTNNPAGSEEVGLKLELLADRSSIGVYLIDDGIGPSPTRSTVNGFISLVAPTRFSFKNFSSVNGGWAFYERNNRPIENPKFDYINFKSSGSFTVDSLTPNSPVLLFTLEPREECPDDLHLKDFVDPFNAPNSKGSNPSNDIRLYDAQNNIVFSTKFIYTDSVKLCARGDGTTSRLETIHLKDKVRIIPNPNNGNFKIDLGELREEDIQISIANNLGQSVFKSQLTNFSKNIKLNLPNGIYSILIYNREQFTISKRLIISN